ncbi:MAG: hypothetical protein GC159_01075 [Phycisphaera sp.]|nr:hypothetical protein [Phycisphaera sp.]
MNLQTSEAEALAILFGMQTDRSAGQGVEELAGALSGQLSMPLSDLTRMMPWVTRDLRRARRTLKAEVETVADMLSLDSPPVELLRMLKSYAKLCYHDPAGVMDKEVALMLYYAAITVALIKHDEVITSLKRPRLIRSLNSRLNKAWIDPRLEELFHDALAAMGAEAQDEPLGKIAEIKSGTGSTAA